MSVSIEVDVYFVLHDGKIVMASLEQSGCRAYVNTVKRITKHTEPRPLPPVILSRKVDLSPK